MGSARSLPEQRDADHLPPPSVEVKNEWSCTTTLVCLRGLYRDGCTFLQILHCLQLGHGIQGEVNQIQGDKE